MADLLQLLKDKDLIEFATNYNYKTNFMGSKLFTQKKTRNLKAEAKMLADGANLTVSAKAVAYDAEAPIGDRANFEELKVEKIKIAEKLNIGERQAYYIDEGVRNNDDMVRYIFNDIDNLMSRVLARTERMNMELLSTGSVVIDENGANQTISYGLPKEHMLKVSGWNTASHDILKDIEQIRTVAQSKGRQIVRAVTSKKVLGYMLKNTAIKGYFEDKVYITTDKIRAWLLDQLGIDFVLNDEIFTTSLSGNGTVNRFFDEDAICFLSTRTAIGEGLFGVTPTELFKSIAYDSKMLLTIHQYNTDDPAGIWTKVEGVYVPVPYDINGMFIAKVTA